VRGGLLVAGTTSDAGKSVLTAGHLDTAAVSRLIGHGAPPGLPAIPPAGVR